MNLRSVTIKITCNTQDLTATNLTAAVNAVAASIAAAAAEDPGANGWIYNTNPLFCAVINLDPTVTPT